MPRSSPLATKPPPENALVWLLDMPPAVTAVRSEPPRPPCPVRHRIAVSASHAVLSHAVPETRTPCVTLNTPKLPPCTVTLKDPEAAAFARLDTLADPRSADSTAVKEPARWPAVTLCRMLPCPPEDERQSTDVSDAHSVSSHAVMPPDPASEYDICPRLAPWRVTLDDPVPSPLDVRTALAPSISTVNASDALPARRPEVTVMRRLEGDPSPTFADKAVSDAQEVSSHADHPAEAAHVGALAPRCAPCTVTLAAPDAALFRVPTRLVLTESTVKPSDVVPA